MTERILIVSDTHMAAPDPTNSFRAGEQLADFVEREVGQAITLVFAGDVLDLLEHRDRPRHLDLVGAPSMVRGVVDEITGAAWGRRLFAALGNLARQGGRIVVIPGNHDPELLHPDATTAFRAAAGLDVDDERLSFHRTAQPWTDRVGQWEVVVGHGNRVDPFNDIEPQVVLEALRNGEERVELPPGSLLVLETLNVFKRAVNPDGTRRFPFVDHLQPSTLGVPLLLIYLDPKLALKHLPGLGGTALGALRRAIRRAILGGPTLSSTSTATTQDLATNLAAAIAAGLTEQERGAAAEGLAEELDTFLADGLPGEVAAGTLAAHHGRPRSLLRAALRRLSDDHTQFDTNVLSALDRAIVDSQLPTGVGPRVVVVGHTHVAREHHLDDDRVFINTGTWIDLMRLPTTQDDAALKAWIDRLEAGAVETEQHLHYAEITAAGPRLQRFIPR